MGASSYTFACATPAETMEDWLGGIARALTFYGGVPQLIVPDFVPRNKIELLFPFALCGDASIDYGPDLTLLLNWQHNKVVKAHDELPFC
jgi:hypothetical protein